MCGSRSSPSTASEIDPEALKKFASARDLDPSRWRLYHGDRAAVRELAMVLGIRYKKDARGDFDHSNVISILDREGVIRHQQVGLGQEPDGVRKPAREPGALADRPDSM